MKKNSFYIQIVDKGVQRFKDKVTNKWTLLLKS